jgi:DNA polymerase III sliding clamp (beta) subunit (PCNA family)
MKGRILMQRSDLITALEYVKPGLADKEHIVQSTSFAFIKGKVVTYNDEISVSHPVPELNIEGAIQAEELYKILSKLKKEELDITMNGSEIIFTSGKVRTGFVLQDKIKLPLDAIGSHSKWKPLPTDLFKALNFVSFACSSDMSRPLLTCINIKEDGDIEASDGYRIVIHHAFKKTGLPIKTVLIPATTIRKIWKNTFVEIAEGEGWIHFKTDVGTVFSCRTFYGDEFPNVGKYTDIEGMDFEFPQTIEDVLDRASVFCKKQELDSDEITITLRKRRMVVRGQSTVGWFEEEVNLRYDGEEKSFSINPELLKDVLSLLKKCILSDNAIKFIGTDWEYVSILKAKESEA